MMGLEPILSGATIQCSTKLSYIHRVILRAEQDSNLRIVGLRPTSLNHFVISSFCRCAPIRTEILKVGASNATITPHAYINCAPDGTRTHNTQFKRLVRSSSCATRAYLWIRLELSKGLCVFSAARK